MTPKPPRIFIWEVAWSNPHKPRPDGFPQVMLRVEQVRPAGAGSGPCPAEIDECWQEMHPYGYCVRVYIPHQPTRQLSLETKQRIRRRNLWKRLLKRYPLYASDWYAEQVQARPEHYGPYIAGEWADVQFARTAMGYLREVRSAQS